MLFFNNLEQIRDPTQKKLGYNLYLLNFNTHVKLVSFQSFMVILEIVKCHC